MSPRPPSFSSVAAFEAAARHQSFAKAAVELNLTDGAVSHSIRGLEARLGTRLFDRHGRGVVLTEAGRVFASRIRLSLGLLSAAFETRPWVESSRLVVSVLPSFALRVLAPRLPDFTARHPEIELVLQATWRLAEVGDGPVDVGIRFGPGGWSGLSAARLATERLFPVMSPSLRPRPREPEALLGAPLLGHPEQPWGPWLAAAGVDAPEPRPVMTIDDSVLALELAARGVGLALARGLIAEPDLRAGRLVKPFDVEIAADYAYWMVWSPVSPKLPAITQFHAWLAEQFA